MTQSLSLQTLLARKGITNARGLARALGCTRQMAHLYWRSFRSARDPVSGQRVRVPMPLGRVVATRLATHLHIPLRTLLLASWTHAETGLTEPSPPAPHLTAAPP
jgi:hypothetical protein